MTPPRLLVDCLCHLEDPRIDDRSALLKRAAAAGIGDVIWAGTDPLRDITRPLREAAPAPLRLWHAFGIHPQHVRDDALPAQLRELDRLLDAPHVVALGECGLDRRPGMPPLELQRRALRAQLDRARARGLPLLLHAVRAMGPLLELLQQAGPLAAGGMVHGFTGSAQSARELVSLGLHVSFGGVVTKPAARHAREAARVVPAARLLVESDAPDHPPAGVPARQAEPAHISHTLAALATLRGEPYPALAARTADNAGQLFARMTPC